MLTAFIQHYNANNNIQNQGEIVNKTIPIFMQQMFYNLVRKTKKMTVIATRCEKLDKILTDELFCLQDDDKTLSVTPFLEAIQYCRIDEPLCRPDFGPIQRY